MALDAPIIFYDLDRLKALEEAERDYVERNRILFAEHRDRIIEKYTSGKTKFEDHESDWLKRPDPLVPTIVPVALLDVDSNYVPSPMSEEEFSRILPDNLPKADADWSIEKIVSSKKDKATKEEMYCISWENSFVPGDIIHNSSKKSTLLSKWHTKRNSLLHPLTIVHESAITDEERITFGLTRPHGNTDGIYYSVSRLDGHYALIRDNESDVARIREQDILRLLSQKFVEKLEKKRVQQGKTERDGEANEDDKKPE